MLGRSLGTRLSVCHVHSFPLAIACLQYVKGGQQFIRMCSHHTISTLHSPIPVQVLKLKHIHSSGMLLTRNSTSEWSYQFSRSIPAHGGRYLKTYLRRYIRRYLQIPACRGRYLTCLLRQVFTNTHAYKWVFTNTHADIRSRYLLNTSVCISKYP